MSVAFLFPGQGAQRPGMLRELHDDPAVRETLQAAEDELRVKLERLDSAEALRSTTAVQLATFIGSVAAARSLIAMSGRPSVVGGHSVGAYAAAVVAGALPYEAGLRIVKLRGELMERAYPAGYGMGVVSGMTESAVRNILQRATSAERPVFVANINAPAQIVIAGAVPAIEAAFELAGAAGARQASLLRVSVPSHCPLLDAVSERLAEALSVAELRDAAIPFAVCSAPQLVQAAAHIRRELAVGVAVPVRWDETARLMYESGARLFVELPPGRALSELARAAFPDARAVAAEETGLESSAYFMLRAASADRI